MNTSPSLTLIDPEPDALFWFVSCVYTPFTPICGGSKYAPSLVWYDHKKSIVSTSAGIVVSILTQFAPGHPSGPCSVMMSSTTSTEPLQGFDSLYVHSPSVSALAGLANSANPIAGTMISHLLRKCVRTRSIPSKNGVTSRRR